MHKRFINIAMVKITKGPTYEKLSVTIRCFAIVEDSVTSYVEFFLEFLKLILWGKRFGCRQI